MRMTRWCGTAVPAVLASLFCTVVAQAGTGIVLPSPTPTGRPTATPTPAPCPAKGATISWCYDPAETPTCAERGGIFGTAPCAAPSVCVTACPTQTPGTPTPTPTPTATATPAVTPTPTPDWTLTALSCRPFAGTYCQNVQTLKLVNGDTLLAFNGGHLAGESTVPAPYGSPGNGIGECKIVNRYPADGSTPTQRVIYCTGQGNTGWETGCFNCAEPGYGLLCFGNRTNRINPPGNRWREAHTERLRFSPILGLTGSTPMDDPSPGIYQDVLTSSGPVMQFDLGVVLIGGIWHLYYSEYQIDPTTGTWFLPKLRRVAITQTGMPEYESWGPVDYSTVASGGGVGNIVLDLTGTKLLAVDEGDPSDGVLLWQSADWGLTWTSTGLVIPVAPGFAGVSDCHIASGPGGVALSPLWFVCQMTTATPDWTVAGNLVLYVVAQQGAQLPPNLFTLPTTWTGPAATPTPTPTPTKGQ